jgi:phage protein D
MSYVKSGAYPIFDPAGVKAQKTVNTVKVMMGEGMHDTAIITLRGESQDTPELQPGTPVQMSYGWATVDMDWFYGYIDHIETHYDRYYPEGSTYEDVVCLGVSYALKDPIVGSWTNVPTSYLVQQVAQQYFLATVIETDDYVWPQLASPGASAWTWLKQLAAKTGYSLAVNKSLLRYVSIDTAMNQYWANMPVFKSRNVAPNYFDQSISRFKALQGEALPLVGHTKAIRQISGINLHTGTIVNAADDTSNLSTLGVNSVYPFFSQQISDQVVSDQGHAQAILRGMSQSNRFAYQATATLSGLTSVKQGMPLVISGIDSNQDGVWWCQEVTHKFTADGYSMDVCLGRDSLGDSGLRPMQTTATAYAPSNPFVYAATNNPPTVLINKHWRAANQFNVNIG